MEMEIFEITINELYSYYDAGNSLKNIVYMHPMFYNGTFCENNSCKPSKPDELLTKEEFTSKINNDELGEAWSLAFKVLYCYISREKCL